MWNLVGGSVGGRFLFLRPRLRKQILKDRTRVRTEARLQGLVFLEPGQFPAPISNLLLKVETVSQWLFSSESHLNREPCDTSPIVQLQNILVAGKMGSMGTSARHPSFSDRTDLTLPVGPSVPLYGPKDAIFDSC